VVRIDQPFPLVDDAEELGHEAVEVRRRGDQQLGLGLDVER
jgi:hypothetical protein